MSNRGNLSSSLHSKKLGEILIDQGSLNSEQLKQALELQENTNCVLGQLLVRMKFCEATTIAAALHQQVKVTDIRLSRLKINPDAAAYFERSFCEANKLLPFEVVGDLICVSMANPLNRSCVMDAQKKLTGMTIKVFRTPWPEISRSIDPTFTTVEKLQAAAKDAARTHARETTAAALTKGPISGSYQLMGTSTSQPGFERPPSANRPDAPVSTGTVATVRQMPANPAPVRPAPSHASAAAAAPGITVDDSWIGTKQNPHIVFHQRMINTIGQLAAPQGFLRSSLEVTQRQAMIAQLGFLLAEYGALLPQSVDFTMGPDALKMLEWQALVLRGLFCYHLSYAYLFEAEAKAFQFANFEQLRENFTKVQEHFSLFIKELASLRDHADKLVHCNLAEVDHTIAQLERLRLLLPDAPPEVAAE